MTRTRVGWLGVGMLALVLVGAGCQVPGVAFVKRLLGKTEAPLPWKSYNDELNGVTFRYPEAWGDPIRRTQDAYTVFDFKNATILRIGTPKDADSHVRPFQDVVSMALAVPEAKRRDLLVDGRAAVEVAVNGKTTVFAPLATEGMVLELVKGEGASMEDVSALLDGFHSTLTASVPEHPQPFLTGIVPAKGKVGASIVLQGKSLMDGIKTTLWIENASGTRGYVPVAKGSTAEGLRFTLASKYCTSDPSALKAACTSFVSVTPGTYKLVAEPWGVKSNAAAFEVTK